MTFKYPYFLLKPQEIISSLPNNRGKMNFGTIFTTLIPFLVSVYAGKSKSNCCVYVAMTKCGNSNVKSGISFFVVVEIYLSS